MPRRSCVLFAVAALIGAASYAPTPAASAAETAALGIVHRSDAAGSETATSALTVATPPGAVKGDVLVARVANRGDVAATLSAAGWTAVGSTHSASLLKSWVFYRVVTGTEPASYTFTQDATTSMAGTISAFSGVDTANPVDDFAGKVNGNSKTFRAPAVTSTAGNDVAVWFGTQLGPVPLRRLHHPRAQRLHRDDRLVPGFLRLRALLRCRPRQLGSADDQPATVMAPPSRRAGRARQTTPTPT